MSPAQDKRYVYLMQTKKQNIFKIGYSINIKKRIQNLDASHEDYAPFVDLASIYTSKFTNVETYMHDRYEKYRLRGEYFYFPANVLNTVLNEFNVLNYAYSNQDVVYDLFIYPHLMDKVRQTRLEMLDVNSKFTNVFNGRPVITVDEAHEYTGIKKHTIYRYLRSGFWESFALGSTYLIYLDQDLKSSKRRKRRRDRTRS